MTPADEELRRRIARSSRRAIVVAVISAGLALCWLGALTEPGNAGGVVVLEVMTLVPLALAVRRTRRLGRRLADIGPDVSAPRAASPLAHPDEPVVRSPVALEFDATRPVLLRARLRRSTIVAGAAGFLALVLGLTWLSYSDAYFDSRIVLIAVQGVVLAVVALRAELVVAGSVLWRRHVRRYGAVRLDRLASVVARPRRRVGPAGIIVIIGDTDGRFVSFVPRLWNRECRSLVAGVFFLATDQRLALDEQTARSLTEQTERAGGTPTWPFSALAAAPVPDPPHHLGTSTWSRQDADGRPTRFRLRVLFAGVAVLAASIPVVNALGRVGTTAVRAIHCDNARDLWEDATVGAPTSNPDLTLAGAKFLEHLLYSPRSDLGVQAIYPLESHGIANHDNSREVQRLAQEGFVAGVEVEWADGGRRTARVTVATFSSPETAAAFQRAWGEDHCRMGQNQFSLAEVPGSVGFRCNCSSELTYEMVSFVRGNIRVMVNVDWLPRHDDHRRIRSLAVPLLKVVEDHSGAGTPVYESTSGRR